MDTPHKANPKSKQKRPVSQFTCIFIVWPYFSLCDTGRQHKQTTQADNASKRRHRQTTQANDTGRQRKQTTQADNASKQCLLPQKTRAAKLLEGIRTTASTQKFRCSITRWKRGVAGGSSLGGLLLCKHFLDFTRPCVRSSGTCRKRLIRSAGSRGTWGTTTRAIPETGFTSTQRLHGETKKFFPAATISFQLLHTIEFISKAFL